MQNKFSDNSKSPIFTQNYLLQITITLAKSNNLRSPLEVIPLHNKFNLYTIPNNSLHLNPLISQISLLYLLKRSNYFLLKAHITLPSQSKLSPKTPISKSIFLNHQKSPSKLCQTFAQL